MARKKQEEEGGGSWMDTYGDLVTLLLTFFVMLYSMATVAEDKWSALVRAFNNRFGKDQVDQIVIVNDIMSDGEHPLDNTQSGMNLGPENEDQVTNQINELYAAISQYIADNDMQDKIEVQQSEVQTPSEATTSSTTQVESTSHGQTSKNVYIQFKNDVLFNPDESTLKEGADKILKFLGETLKKVDDSVAMIVIKGHTADAKYSTVDERLLSSNRAAEISNYLQRTKGIKIASTKLYPLGLGKDYPIAPNDTEENMSKNRRVEIVIIGKDSEMIKSGELLKILGASFTQGTGSMKEIASTKNPAQQNASGAGGEAGGDAGENAGNNTEGAEIGENPGAAEGTEDAENAENADNQE